MLTLTKVIIIIGCLLCLSAPIFAQSLPVPASETPKMQSVIDQAIFKSLYNKPRLDEKEISRAQWEKAFGFDVWLPYYKAKEIEDKINEKLSIKIFKIKGKPKIRENQIRYTFTVRY